MIALETCKNLIPELGKRRLLFSMVVRGSVPGVEWVGVSPDWPGPFSLAQEPVSSPAETEGLPSAVLLGRP